MGKTLKELRRKKLFNELEFLKSDEEFKTEFIKEHNADFNAALRKFLVDNPDFKNELEEKFKFSFGDLSSPPSSENNQPEPDKDSPHKITDKKRLLGEGSKNQLLHDLLTGIPSIDGKELIHIGPSEGQEDSHKELKTKVNQGKNGSEIKKLYRKIVVITHPDKIKHPGLNSMYVAATRYYKNDDLFGIYLICNKLGIKYIINKEGWDDMGMHVQELKTRVRTLEQTYLWIWTHAAAERKVLIIKDFLSKHGELIKGI